MTGRIALALAAALFATLLASPVANADTAGCVSKREYYSAARGWTPKRVAKVFDTAGAKVFDKTYSQEIPQASGGVLVTWYQVVVRSYKKCANFDGGRGRVGVRFLLDPELVKLYEDPSLFRFMVTHKTRRHPEEVFPY